MITFIGLIAAAVGFCIALYIYRKQHAKKPLMCPRNAPCETVVASPQARTFGISNTVLGMVYYGIQCLLLVVLWGGDQSVRRTILILATGGFLFSLYLVWVQKTVIKQWCIWCLGSAAAATLLFLTAIALVL